MPLNYSVIVRCRSHVGSVLSTVSLLTDGQMPAQRHPPLHTSLSVPIRGHRQLEAETLSDSVFSLVLALCYMHFMLADFQGHGFASSSWIEKWAFPTVGINLIL